MAGRDFHDDEFCLERLWPLYVYDGSFIGFNFFPDDLHI